MTEISIDYLLDKYQTVLTDQKQLFMNPSWQHRNKCQNCFRSIGKFILDCFCFLCIDCFSKNRSKQGQCQICGKESSGKFIDTQDQTGVAKVNYLFSDVEKNLEKCTDIYRFQSTIDMRYIRYLENQLGKYKELLSNIINENPRLKDYVNNFFKVKATPYRHRSVSQNLQNHSKGRTTQVDRSYVDSKPSRRSNSSNSVQNYHEQLVSPRPVNQGDRNFSAKVGYKVPNINYNTALRSSKRPNSRPELEDEDRSYYRH